MLGVVVTSSSTCVASRCARTRAGTGAVATQNRTDPALGDLALDLLDRGLGARTVCEMLVRADRYHEYRQHVLIDATGETAVYTGARASPTCAQATGPLCAAAGNILRSDAVPLAMVEAFALHPERELAERLLDAADAGLNAGGEVRELRSAGMLAVDRQRWPVVDLRVDEQAEPLTELRRIWRVYAPEQAGYVARAAAPYLFDVPAPAVPAASSSRA
jgi:uncharacterized Ntn-hydrolase superfamily protein